MEAEKAADPALVLVIDDSPTIRKMVECHLSQAGYRVAVAADAANGLKAAATMRPSLILLDHQLPGTTGDQVCRQLLADEATAQVPVVVCSALRNRAFAAYTEFSNVIDQIPKPFTPELLTSGVANALETGAVVMQAQRTGCAMPETIAEPMDAVLEGSTAQFPLRATLDFLNNLLKKGHLVVDLDRDRIRFVLGSGRIQAVFAPTLSPQRVLPFLPADQLDLAPLLAVTLAERHDASISGLVKLLEKSLADPGRLRSFLRSQAAILTYLVLEGESGRFAFEPEGALPPMFQAFPLQISLPALALEGQRLCAPATQTQEWAGKAYARRIPRGGNLDRAGLSPADLKSLTLLDGTQCLEAVAAQAGQRLDALVAVVRGLERIGWAEACQASSHASILVLDDTETIDRIRSALAFPDSRFEIKAVHDKIGAQLLLKRGRFDLLIMALDGPEQEALYRQLRTILPAMTRVLGVTCLNDEEELARLDAMDLDGVLHRPIVEADAKTAVEHVLAATKGENHKPASEKLAAALVPGPEP